MNNKEVPPPSYYEATSPPPTAPTAGQYQYPPSPQFPAQNAPLPHAQMPPVNFGPVPQQAYCPTCKQTVLSEASYVSGPFTWLLVVLCSLICCCCLLPLCLKSCKDCVHRCPQCYTYLGTYQRGFGAAIRGHGQQRQTPPVSHV